MNVKDKPYTLASVTERERRHNMLAQPHIKPLIDFLVTIRTAHPDKDLPLFDPCDGGVKARALFLLEAPGPKAVNSEFISRNNPDPTARNMFGLLENARISRTDTLLWNIVPWYVGDTKRIRAVNKKDVELALPYLEKLLGLLPLLSIIILVGRKAQSAKNDIKQFTRATALEAFHPSARVFNSYPEKRLQTQNVFLKVASLLAIKEHST